MREAFDLRVVPLADVVPHEEADPRRVEKMVGRLEADGWLANPPIVFAVDERFVLLDGANRIAALDALGFQQVIVQVASPTEMRLETWHHVLLGTTPDGLLDTLASVPDVRLDDDSESGSAAAPTMCSLRLADGRTYVAHPAAGTHPFTALNPFVGAYLDLAVVSRTTNPDLAAALSDHPDAAGLVAFPLLTTDEVFNAAHNGARLPAGITRFVIAGRVLAVNAPLAPLRSDRTLDELNEWLAELVATRRAQGRIRHYPESVFVLDD
ncbi:MAG: hypothetical protein ACRD29_25665 [Acidimicrobiales bacterium]